MRLREFAGVTLPDAQHVSDLTRVVEMAMLKPTGALLGDYDLYGSQSPMSAQTYQADFMFAGATQAGVDALLAKIGARGTLKQTMWDASVRQTEAKLAKVAMATTVEDKHAGVQRVSCEFRAEPLWYAGTATTVSFSSLTSVNVTGASGNLGNARAIKHLVLTITTHLAGALTISIIPSAGQQAAIEYTAATSDTLVIDAGAHTVREGTTDRYAQTSRAATQVPLLFLEPGNSVLSFDIALSGSLVFRSAWR